MFMCTTKHACICVGHLQSVMSMFMSMFMFMFMLRLMCTTNTRASVWATCKVSWLIRRRRITRDVGCLRRHASLTAYMRHCNTLQHNVTHCNTLQHTPAICLNRVTHVKLENTATLTCLNHVSHCNTLQHAATLCNTLQHTATHCNTYLWHASITINWKTLQHRHA